MPKKRQKNPKPYDWVTARSSVVIPWKELPHLASLSGELKSQISRLKPVKRLKIKDPITRDPKTCEVRDATGRVFMYCGPQFWKAMKSFKK